jgi:hypothetical protein
VALAVQAEKHSMQDGSRKEKADRARAAPLGDAPMRDSQTGPMVGTSRPAEDGFVARRCSPDEEELRLSTVVEQNHRKEDRMWFVELLWALGLALLVGSVFWAVTRSGRTGSAEGTGFSAVFWLFLILFLGTWAVGAWVEPIGPVWGGVAWLPFLWAALMFVLLVAAAAGTDWGTYRGRHRRDSTEAPTESGAAARADEAETAVAAVSIFVWFVLFLALIALFARYLAD